MTQLVKVQVEYQLIPKELMTVWNFGMYKSDTRAFANEYGIDHDEVVKTI